MLARSLVHRGPYQLKLLFSLSPVGALGRPGQHPSDVTGKPREVRLGLAPFSAPENPDPDAPRGTQIYVHEFCPLIAFFRDWTSVPHRAA